MQLEKSREENVDTVQRREWERGGKNCNYENCVLRNSMGYNSTSFYAI